MNAFNILWQYRDAFLGGLLVTGQLVALTALLGTNAGIALELLSRRFPRYVRRLLDCVAFCIAAIPALVILFWLYYPGQALLGINASPFATAVTSLTIINAFGVYRALADATSDLPKQFIATGLVCGLSRSQIFRYIEVPLLVRATLPRWLDQQVVILQTRLFASLISVDETFRVAQRINSVIYQPVLIYTSMAFLFLATAGSAMYLA